MLKVGIIGCGNAGNQVCACSMQMYPDIPVIAINCSENDIHTIPDSITSFLIGDGKGAGKKRDEAKKFLESYIMTFVSDPGVRSFLSELDLVFVVSSTGGGTGSGIALLLSSVISSLVADSENPVFPIPVGILPTLAEAPGTQENTLSYLRELYEVMEKPTYMLYDNEKLSKLTTPEMMESVNRKVVEDINIIRGYYNTPTRYNSIDEKDAMMIYTTPGRLIVASLFDIKDKDIDGDTTIENLLCQEIRKNCNAPVEFDSVVNRTGIIVNISENLSKGFNSHIPEVRKLIGTPIEEFEHICINDDRKLPNSVILVASGMSRVNSRITEIKNKLEDDLEKQQKFEEESELDAGLINEVKGKRVYRNTSPVAASPDGNKGSLDLRGIFDAFK